MLKLASLAFAKRIDGRSFTLVGTPEYIAPEILTNRGHGVAADLWSFGVLLYELLHGSTPFYSEDPMQIYAKILAGNVRFAASVPSAEKHLIRSLLTRASKRPAASSLVQPGSSLPVAAISVAVPFSSLHVMPTPCDPIPDDLFSGTIEAPDLFASEPMWAEVLDMPLIQAATAATKPAQKGAEGL